MSGNARRSLVVQLLAFIFYIAKIKENVPIELSQISICLNIIPHLLNIDLFDSWKKKFEGDSGRRVNECIHITHNTCGEWHKWLMHSTGVASVRYKMGSENSDM